MQSVQKENKFRSLLVTRTIQWGVAALLIIVLAVLFYVIFRYVLGTPDDSFSSTYLTFVLTLLIIWFIGIIFFLVYMILKYDPLKNQDSPYINETLSLPPGLFRVVLTITLLFAVILLEGYALTNIDKMKEIQQILEPLLTAFQLMIAFYFGTKMVGMVSGKGETEARAKG